MADEDNNQTAVGVAEPEDQLPENDSGSETTTGAGSAVSRRPKIIVFSRPFSGQAFVSSLTVNQKAAYQNGLASLRPNDEVVISGRELAGFPNWVLFQKGKAGKKIPKLIASSGSVIFRVPDWSYYFDSKANLLLTFTKGKDAQVWGIPVKFIFVKKEEAEEGSKAGEQGQRQAGKTAGEAPGAAVGPTGAIMQAAGEAMAGVVSPFIPYAERNANRKALEESLKSGNKDKVIKDIQKLKNSGDLDGLRDAAKIAGKQHLGLINDAIYETSQAKISSEENAHALEEIARTVDSADFDEGLEVELQKEQVEGVEERETTGGIQSELTGSTEVEERQTVTRGGGGSASVEVSGEGTASEEVKASGIEKVQVQGTAGEGGAEVKTTVGSTIKTSGEIGVVGQGGQGQVEAIIKQVGPAAVGGAAKATIAGEMAVSGGAQVQGAVLQQPGAGGLTLRQSLDIVGKHLDKNPGLILDNQVREKVLQALGSGNLGGLDAETRVALKQILQKPVDFSKPDAAQLLAAKKNIIDGAFGSQELPSAVVSGAVPKVGAPPAPQASVAASEGAPSEPAPAQEVQPPEQPGAEPSPEVPQAVEPGTQPAAEGLPAEEQKPEDGEEAKQQPSGVDQKPPPEVADKLGALNKNDQDLARALGQQLPVPPGQKEDKGPKGESIPGKPLDAAQAAKTEIPKSDKEAPVVLKTPERGLGSKPPLGAPPGVPPGPPQVPGKEAPGGSSEPGEQPKAGEKKPEEEEEQSESGAPLEREKGQEQKNKKLEEALAPLNKALNEALTKVAYWVWGTIVGIPLGAIVGDAILVFKKPVAKAFVKRFLHLIPNWSVGKEIPSETHKRFGMQNLREFPLSVYVTEEELADGIKISGQVKAHILAMNLVVAALVGIIVFAIMVLVYIGCHWPVGKVAGSYKLSVMGLAGYSSICESIETVGTAVSLYGPVGALSNAGSAAICAAVTSGPASVASLSSTCFGQNANTASIVAGHESGGQAFTPSGVDICLNQNGDKVKVNGQDAVVSWGLFQINISAHKIGSLNCPGAFDRMYTAQNHQCNVTNPGLYSQCVNAAKDAQQNITTACQLSSNGTNWKDWLADILACRIQ